MRNGCAFGWTKAEDVWIESPPTKRPEGRRRFSGWIYAMRGPHVSLVKIGCTRKGVPQRLACLARTLRADVVLLGAVYMKFRVFEVEGSVHALLASACIEGEWFRISMDQKTLEALVRQAYGVLLLHDHWWLPRLKR
jgi:hypothetical protein